MAAQQDANTEPSIEEILDSIRQIISDDEGDGPAEASAHAMPATAPAQKPAMPVAAQGDDVIELTQRVEEPARPAQPSKEPAPAAPIEIDMQEPPAPARPPVMTPPPAPPADNNDGLLTKAAEDAAMNAFSELAQRAAIEKSGTITIEDVVRYEIRPLLRGWIDKHLPGIVERLVQKELEKISRKVED